MTDNETAKILRKGMLILDCTSERSENKSEGLLIKELTRILKPSLTPNIITIRGVSRFKRELQNSTDSVVHISAHGRYYRKKRTQLCFPNGKKIDSLEIKKSLNKRREKPTIIVFSACSVGNEDLIRNLNEATVKYAIAPSEDTYWFDAAIFLTTFYRFLLVENHSVWIAFRKVDRMRKLFFPKLTGNWNLYKNGKLCFSSPYDRYSIGQKLELNV